MTSRRQRPVIAMGLIENPDGQLLICRRLSDGAKPHRWEFPSTVMKASESPEAAMRRAAKEGVGLTLTVSVGQPPFDDTFDGQPATYRIFICSTETGDASALGPYGEIRWVQPGQLIEYDFPSQIHDVVKWYTGQQEA